uniref:Uncharacterized protein n=1 Tax=Schizaphis graminum TaxID=13262 RepID=A0A2S2NYZ9_SCHGA
MYVLTYYLEQFNRRDVKVNRYTPKFYVCQCYCDLDLLQSSGYTSNIHNNIIRVIYHICVSVRPVMCFAYGAHEEILEEHQDRLGVPPYGVALLANRNEVRKD